MLDKLKNKWKVSGIQLFLILCTFAMGGSLCGYVGRKILSQLPIEKGPLWVAIYIFLITILWPMAVIAVSIPLGQFSFFKNYLRRIAGRMSGKKSNAKENATATDSDVVKAKP